MSSGTTFIAQFAVYMTVRDVEKQVKLYTEYGFVADDDFDAVGDVPEEYWTARGVSGSDVVKTKALKLPADPYMHLVLTQFKSTKEGPTWPAPYDQAGSRAHAFLVKSVDSELKRLQKDFGNDIKILHQPITVERKWGKTTTALLLDPQGVFFELVEIDTSGSYFSRDLKMPNPEEKAWLHFMMNFEDISRQLPFYKSFDMIHDHRVDFRNADIGFLPRGVEIFAKEHEEAMSMVQTDSTACHFLWHWDEPSTMHLELLEYKPGTLKDPDSKKPIWPQKGISRFCFRTPTKEKDLERGRKNGHNILIPDNTICVGWGDSEYFYFGDTEGNLLTSEQWHHHGYFGLKN